jgi:hypothetical protein
MLQRQDTVLNESRALSTSQKFPLDVLLTMTLGVIVWIISGNDLGKI